MNEAEKTITTSARKPLPRPDELEMMDRSAFMLAFHEEMQGADPNEPIDAAFDRAMTRVQAFLADRAARSKAPDCSPKAALRMPGA